MGFAFAQPILHGLRFKEHVAKLRTLRVLLVLPVDVRIADVKLMKGPLGVALLPADDEKQGEGPSITLYRSGQAHAVRKPGDHWDRPYSRFPERPLGVRKRGKTAIKFTRKVGKNCVAT